MPNDLLTKEEQRVSKVRPITAPAADNAATRRQATRVRRLKINVAAWLVGSFLVTTLWLVNEWQANGAFESFGHEGNDGQWNPTLWALVVGLWSLAVGIMALRVRFGRPVTGTEVARKRLERTRRFQFHVAAWVLGMVVLTPLWALIEWQDNGGFERWSNNSRPGDWEPWILYVGGIWALAVAILALRAYLERPTDGGRD